MIQLKDVEMMENTSDPDGLQELNAAVVRMNSKKAKALASKSQVLYAGSFSLDKKKYDNVPDFWNDYSTTSVR